MIGRINSYSEMLRRIFWFNVGTGLFCSVLLSFYSPAVERVVKNFGHQIEIEGAQLPALLVLGPLAFALTSRIIVLHNKISDCIGIRERFDTQHIVLPLAAGCGIQDATAVVESMKSQRRKIMSDVFYKYVPNMEKSVINGEYVAAALDAWGWFWCFVEASATLVVAAIFAIFAGTLWLTLFFAVVALMSAGGCFLLMSQCVSAAADEVREILVDDYRKQEIYEALHAL